MGAIADNNFFFTIDQGRDAVFVREILERQQMFLKGPETSIRGIFTGPLWYYFVSLGYFFTNGHPIGGIYPLIALNLLVTIVLVLVIAKKVNKTVAIIVALGLQLFWPFFQTSLFSFNPFPVVALSIFLLLAMIGFLEKRERKYLLWGLVPIFFAFNANLASAMTLLVFYLLFALWTQYRSIPILKNYLAVGILPLTLTQSRVFSTTNFTGMASDFTKIIGSTTFPFDSIVGFLIFLAITGAYFYSPKKNPFVKRFTVLTLSLLVISFFFFSSNQGWRDWHTAYLAPLLFISLLLMLTTFSKRISVLGITLVVIVQGIFFFQRYQLNLQNTKDDPSILTNQLKVVDWIYDNAENQAFSSYNYTSTFFDHPYQYLFWWYGIDNYEYLPHEYANYPLSPKELYVPGFTHYLEPKRGGDRIKFLVIESSTNGEDNKDWPDKFRKYHNLVAQTKIGKIKIEKYYKNQDAPDEFCIWWEKCN